MASAGGFQAPLRLSVTRLDHSGLASCGGPRFSCLSERVRGAADVTARRHLRRRPSILKQPIFHALFTRISASNTQLRDFSEGFRFILWVRFPSPAPLFVA